MSRSLIAGVTGALLTLVVATAEAQVSGPSFVFSNGTVISAAEVNTDFSTIYANALNRFAGVMAGGLTFSPDNSFDIGASGATRPRDLFLGRNAAVGGTLAVTGAATFAGAVTFSGGVNAIPETAITDGSILARVAGNETITGAYTFTNITGPRFNTTAPILNFYETDAAANNGRYRLAVDGGGTMTLQTINDAENAPVTVWQVGRTGTTVSSFAIGAAQTLNASGAVGTPSYAFTADSDSGFYFSGTGPSITDDGIKVAEFNSTQTSLTSASVVILPSSGTSIALGVNSNSSTVAYLNRATSDGTLLDLQRDGASIGSISVAGGTVAYNTFMGAHYTQLRPGQGEPDAGLVMVTTGEQIPVKPRRLTKNIRMLDAEGLAIGQQTIDVGAAPVDPAAERFVFTALSSRRNQRGVYGVWHADLGRTAAGMSWGDPDAEVYQIAALGLTTAWVTDTCGNIEKGMLLATSPLPGLAERQCAAGMGKGTTIYDPVQRDYTLGKALVDVDWSTVQPDEDGIRKVRIPVTLHAG